MRLKIKILDKQLDYFLKREQLILTNNEKMPLGLNIA